LPTRPRHIRLKSAPRPLCANPGDEPSFSGSDPVPESYEVAGSHVMGTSNRDRDMLGLMSLAALP
jgi:hypothetical protein